MAKANSETCDREYLPHWAREYAYSVSYRGRDWRMWLVSTPDVGRTPKHLDDWVEDSANRLAHDFEKPFERQIGPCRRRSSSSGIEVEKLRSEFRMLSEQWHRDTRLLSQVSKMVAHPAHLRIVGMGHAAVPLILEALRDRPAHWFVALKSITNADPAPNGATPSQAREAWLLWGRNKGLIE